MIDEESFIKWFNQQYDFEIRCNHREHNCTIENCISTYKVDHEFEQETINIIEKVLRDAETGICYNTLAIRIYEKLKLMECFE